MNRVLPDDDAVTTPLQLPSNPAPIGTSHRRRGEGKPTWRASRSALLLGLGLTVLSILVVTAVVTTYRSGAAAAPAVAAPQQPAPSSAVPAAAPSQPVQRPSPTMVDESGAKLPANAAPGIRAVFAALRSGDVATLQRLYSPSPEGDSWNQVGPRLRQSSVRAQLVLAMQTHPSRGEDVDIIYSARGYAVGFTARGGLRYFQVGQSPSSGSATSASSSTDTADRAQAARGTEQSPSGKSSSADPYGCLAADRALSAGTISYAQHPCASHFQNSADPYQMQPNTPATRWALCHETPRGDDPDYLRGGRARYCH